MLGPLSKLSLLIVLLACLCSIDLRAKANRVAVKAEASKEYLISRGNGERKKIETYHLVKGKFFGGNVADASLDWMSFEEIAEHVALNLKRQNYFPEEDPSAGDLLIMVHYGVTNFSESYDEMREHFSEDNLDFESSNESVSAYDSIPEFRAAFPSDRLRLKQAYFRARMLGMEKGLKSNITSYEAFILGGLIRERRYFTVITAFDLPLLREGKKNILWTTRYSVRSIGQTFDEAIAEMNIVAGHFFGHNMKDLISKRATDKFIVEMGEIEVIGDNPE